MTRPPAAFATVFAAVVLWGGPAAGEFWPTEYFLQQEPGTQNAYVAGLIDMYEHARDDDGFAADPGDWLLQCIRPLRPSEVRAEFIDWLLGDPASWRLSPARLFLDAMRDYCGAP